MWGVDVTVPAEWTINTVNAPPPVNTPDCVVFQPVTQGFTGQTIWWQSSGPRDQCGAWIPGTYVFSANVTINSCSGAPWSLPWNILGDTWGATPHEVSGTYSSVNCTTGTPVIETAAPVAGCDAFVALPSTAVVGQFVANAEVYWAPNQLTNPVVTIVAGKNYWVDGLDESGVYRKVLLGCQWLWVKAGTVGPNPESPWNGTPLPAHKVETSSGEGRER
jgi:hypothetical protein